VRRGKESTQLNEDESLRHEKIESLISGIEHEARNEADRLVEEARAEAERRLLYADKQAESILREASGKAEAQAKKIEEQHLAGVHIESKRLSMKILDELYLETVNRVRDFLERLVGAKEYRNILRDLIVEAAIGLDAASALINASEIERSLITQDLLGEVRDRVKALTGAEVSLTLSKGPPLAEQGVVLTSVDGHLSFNNLIESRLRKAAPDIHRIVDEQLSIHQANSDSESANGVDA
jgi:vacuolar-type H+-ATPase subunit E/Vma4